MSRDYSQIPLNSSTIAKWEMEQLNDFNKDSCVGSKNARRFSRYIQVLNQLIGLISVKGNEDFENRQNQIFECCYINGKVVLTFIKGRLQIWNIAGELKYDINGDIEYVDVLPYTQFGVGSINTGKMKKRRFTGDKVVLIKANPQAFSLWFLWRTIIEDNVDLMGIYLMNSKLNIKKFQWIINNESESIADEEIEEMLNWESPVVKTLNPIVKIAQGDTRAAAGEQNELRPLDISSGDYDFADVVNHWIFETNLMGLFADEYHKKERNTAGENEMTQANTVLLHEVIYREFKRAEKEIKKKFGIQIEFYKTFELSIEDESDTDNGGVDNDKDN